MDIIKNNLGQAPEQRRLEWIKYSKLLILACYLLYVAEFAAKLVFGAEIATIILELKTDKVNASFANTYYYLMYGLVQVILSLFMGKIDMRKYLVITLPFAAISMICMGFATKIQDMWIIFPVSGLFQAGLWSGINLIFTKYLPRSFHGLANRVINTGIPVASIIAYGVGAFCVSLGMWRLPFFILGGVFLLTIIFFSIVVQRTKYYSDMAKEEINDSLYEKTYAAPLFTLENKKQKAIFYFISIFMSFLITAVYNCLCNWLPSLLVDVFSFPQDASIYVSILSPIVMLFGPILTIWSCERDNNFIRQCLIYCLIILPICILMVWFYEVNIIITILLVVLYLGLANGIRTIVLSVMTFQLHTQINAGTYSAISNAVASATGAIIPTFWGYLIDNCGWKLSFVAIVVLMVIIILLLFLLLLLLKNKVIKKKKEVKDVAIATGVNKI